jgi:hypothetical protein
MIQAGTMHGAEVGMEQVGVTVVWKLEQEFGALVVTVEMMVVT